MSFVNFFSKSRLFVFFFQPKCHLVSKIVAESEIDETAKICLMLLEEERQKELRDFERMRHLHVSHASCKDKMAFGG